MISNILITYASRRGSTAEAAEAIAAVLQEEGLDVAVKPIRKVRSITGYDAVVLGTAIRVEKPLSEAIRFVIRFSSELSAVPTALFILCLTMVEDTPETRERVTGWIAPLISVVQPGTVGLFAGAAERDRLGFLLGRLMQKILEGENMKPGDYRNWDEIRKWARALPEVLKSDTEAGQ